MARRGKAGEREARRLLKAHGFRIVATQATRRWAFWVNGEEDAVTLRADFLVRRRGKDYVADAKTGQATKLTALTRRQLLEYRLAFDVDGVLLVDPASRRVSEVVFDLP